MNPPQADDPKDWFEYRRLILSELERISRTLVELNKKIDDLRATDISQLKVDVAMLQVKSGIWGGLAGIVVTMGAILLKYLSAN